MGGQKWLPEIPSVLQWDRSDSPTIAGKWGRVICPLTCPWLSLWDKRPLPEGTRGENISVCCCFAVASLVNFYSDVTNSGPINVIYSVYAVGLGCARGFVAGLQGREEQLKLFQWHIFQPGVYSTFFVSHLGCLDLPHPPVCTLVCSSKLSHPGAYFSYLELRLKNAVSHETKQIR